MTREILNIDQLRECLEDPGLLALAVPIPLSFDLDDLAVPVGGKRRGGELCVPDADVGRAVMTRLSTLPGFPNLRFVPGPEGEDSLGIVRWGEPEPAYPRGWLWRGKLARYDVESGRYYGYSERTIRPESGQSDSG
jgi:hypothetical protein